eukprot:TRINITY_DN38318_c0_g1_i1.p1 TRINITY_DN38318_c0_g1~~TRINITY_DN38318_c0_g1_i1.p1  ORF type:complete len:347 (+),score=100.32 TRINITY_DN38318_c0_g1_i1:62-1102(+)
MQSTSRRPSMYSEERQEEWEGAEFDLREENRELRRALEELQMSHERMQGQMLQKVEEKMNTYRLRTEEEIEKYRLETRKAQERLAVLQRATQHDPTAHDVDEGKYTDLADSLLDVLLNLQDQTDPLNPEALHSNITKAVKQTFGGILSAHKSELDALQETHEQTVTRMTREVRDDIISASSDPSTSPELCKIKRECSLARDDLEEERQRVAMVCIHMKDSLEKKNATFEAAVMGKADDLVRQYKQRADEAERRLEGLTPPKRSPSVTTSAQTEPEPAPQSYLASAVTAEYRREYGIERAEHEATLQFERDVMAKAQSLLQKYSTVVSKERGPPKPIPSVTAICQYP